MKILMTGLLAAMIFVMAVQAAEVTSFDCSKAKTTMEKTVCSDAERLLEGVAFQNVDLQQKLAE